MREPKLWSRHPRLDRVLACRVSTDDAMRLLVSHEAMVPTTAATSRAGWYSALGQTAGLPLPSGLKRLGFSLGASRDNGANMAT